MKIKTIIISLVFYTYLFAQDRYFSEEKCTELKLKLDSICLPIKSQGIKISAKVIHADYGKILYELDPEITIIPASLVKIIVSACAFSKLGASYQIPTIVYTDDPDVNDGAINGNLYIKGYGDPDLNSGDISTLAGELIRRNIRLITGNIVADESFFDKNYYTLRGVYSGDTGPSYWPYVNALAIDKNSGTSDPALYAASLLSSGLSASGVQLDGAVISGITPNGAKEIARLSHSLYDVLSYMNKESDNHSALTIFKLLGAKFKSNPASLEDGQSVIIDYLSEIGVSRYSYEILEGSGLSRYNKVNAELYIKLLKFMYDDLFLFDYFLNSLTIAGKDGTLKNRMKGTSAEGNVYAKTGTLNSVSCLAGYVINKDNEIMIFYIAMNGHGPTATDMRAAQDDFCIALSDFSRK
jgi:D-alanyl-D-alanine carboxypeptidase/D-alanyl-D-alanine-endopeptidase (penicillin-binding protein 4)